MGLRLLLLLAVLTGCVGCDQVSKLAAIEWLNGAPSSSYLADTVRLVYAENRGAFLGLGADWPEAVHWVVFGLLSAMMVGGTLVYSVRGLRDVQSWREAVPLAGVVLIAAGGIGNLVDRALRDGAVVDFMNLGIGPLRTGIFNVADVQIMVGLGLIALWPRERSPSARPPTASHGR